MLGGKLGGHLHYSWDCAHSIVACVWPCAMDMGDIHSCVTLSLCFTGISAGCGFGTLGNFWSILGLGIAVCTVGFPQIAGEMFAQMSRRELGVLTTILPRIGV